MDSPVSEKEFDNILIRVRGRQCLLSTVRGKFITAYWPDVGAVGKELGIPQLEESLTINTTVQKRFIEHISCTLPSQGAFRPAFVGFQSTPNEIRFRDQYREKNCFVTFLGNCSSEVRLGSLGLLRQRLPNAMRFHLRFKRWDALDDWTSGRRSLNEVLRYLAITEQCDCSVMLFSELRSLPQDLWTFVYDCPRVRVVWHASDFQNFSKMDQFEAYRMEDSPLTRLEALAEMGLWPHLIIPATATNTPILPDLVLALADLTRGATMEIVPISLTADSSTDAPAIEDYIRALLKIYRSQSIGLRTIEPQSWVASRIDAEVPLPSSSEAAGAAFAILANGEIYPGESLVGLDQWRIGNVLAPPGDLAWERLDAVTEACSNSLKPQQCRACDWRYRCGGLDASLLLKSWPLNQSQWDPSYEFYCAPRKALFEAALWDSVTSSANENVKVERESLELADTGICFTSAANR